jgi:polysaccharide chain length determinant protein (PEP-CTERM system associated)
MNEVLQLGLIRLRFAWRYRWVGLAAATGLLATSGAALQLYADRYEASAKVHVNTQTVLKPLMRELAAQPDIDLQVRMLARTLITHPRIEKLVDSMQLVDKDASPQQRERVIGDLVTKVRMEGSTHGNLYTISYKDPDPVRARLVVHSLVEMFVDSNTSSKRQDSQQARQFIDAQIAEYEKKLSEAENRLKQFKVKNFGISGATNQDFFARMAATSDEVNRLRLELGAAEQSRDALRRELNSESPQLPLEALPFRTSTGPSESELRLEAQRRQLDELLRRYTDQHPDVVATQRNIAQIEAQRRQEQDAQRRNSQGAAPTNPVFQQLRLSLAQSEAQVASLRSQLAVQQGRLEAVRGQASKMPQVEADLAQLNRDYDVLRRNHQQLVERRESAALGIKLDDSSQLTEFRIIEPASVSSKPVFPSRGILALVAAVLSIVAGVAAAIGMTFVFPTVFDEKWLQAATRRPVLGGVSVALDEPARRLAHVQRLRFSATSGLFLVASCAWVGWVLVAAKV